MREAYEKHVECMKNAFELRGKCMRTPMAGLRVVAGAVEARRMMVRVEAAAAATMEAAMARVAP